VEYNIAHIKPKLNYLNLMQTQAVLKANKHICVCFTVRCVIMNVNIAASAGGGRHTRSVRKVSDLFFFMRTPDGL
jgi:hypothetical protein